MSDKPLAWLKRHPSLPTTPNDRSVRRLVYRSSGEESELGLVCELTGGGYWCVSTSPVLRVMPETMSVTRFDTIEKAQYAMDQHVEKELLRLHELTSTKPYVVERKFKSRDRQAFENYKARDQESFKQGMDWILRSEGFPRRPAWAKYLVQNRDGSFLWFEDMPEPDMVGGWSSPTGRSKPVVIADRWDRSITKIG